VRPRTGEARKIAEVIAKIITPGPGARSLMTLAGL